MTAHRISLPASAPHVMPSSHREARRQPHVLVHWFCIVLAAFSAVSCAHAPSSPSIAQTLEGTWRVDSSGTGTTQTIVFDGERAHGDGGCNRWSAEVLANADGELRFGPVAATRRGCLDADANRRESEFLAMLGEVRSYRDATQGTVELMDARAKVIGTIRR